jgi:hypothetical protein
LLDNAKPKGFKFKFLKKGNKKNRLAETSFAVYGTPALPLAARHFFA